MSYKEFVDFLFFSHKTPNPIVLLPKIELVFLFSNLVPEIYLQRGKRYTTHGGCC